MELGEEIKLRRIKAYAGGGSGPLGSQGGHRKTAGGFLGDLPQDVKGILIVDVLGARKVFSQNYACIDGFSMEVKPEVLFL